MNWEKFVILKNVGFLLIVEFILLFIYAFITSPLTYVINEEIPQWITYTFIYSLILLADSIIFKYARINDPRYQEKAVKILMIYLLPIGLLLANSYISEIIIPPERYRLYPKVFGLVILIGLLIAYISFLFEKKDKPMQILQDITVKISIATLIAIIINGIFINSQQIDKIISIIIVALAIANIIIAGTFARDRTPLYTATVILLNITIAGIKITEMAYKISFNNW